MEILYVLLGISVLALIWCFWLLYRNNKVHSFMIMLINQCHMVNQKNLENGTYNESNDAYDLVEISYRSYEAKLFSFKPLRPIYWLEKGAYDILFPETPYDYEP